MATLTPAYHTAIAIIPPAALTEGIEVMRQQKDKAFERWPPHINLVFPFVEFGVGCNSDLEAALQQTCAALDPFSIELDRFGFFDHGKGAVNCHLKPSPASVGALQGLAEAIDGCLPAELAAKQKRPFSPHLTVGQMPRAEYTERREAWERRRPTDSVFADHDHDRAWTGFATWTCSAVCLLSRDGVDGRMTVGRTLALGGRAAVASPRPAATSAAVANAASATAPKFMTLITENERVRLWDLTLPPGQTARFEHELPCLRWQSGAGVCDHTVDGPPVKARWTGFAGPAELFTVADGTGSVEVGVAGVQGTVYGDRQGAYLDMPPGASPVVWVAMNLAATTAFRQSVVEFLDPSPKHTEAEVAALLRAAVYTTEVGTAKLFENERCRVWDFSFCPGGGDGAVVHQHVLDYIFWFPCSGVQGLGKAKCRLIGYNPDGTEQFDSHATDGDYIWEPVKDGGILPNGEVSPDHRHGGKNGFDDRPFVEYLIELK